MTVYTYGEEQLLCLVVQNPWARTSHPEKGTRKYSDSAQNHKILHSEGTYTSFKQRTSLTCMTLLNNSCPLNMAVKLLRKVYQVCWKNTIILNQLSMHESIPNQHFFPEGYRQLGQLQGAYRMLLFPCLCSFHPCPQECQP